MNMILGIDTEKFYALSEAKKALEAVPNLKYGTRDHNIYFYEMWPLIQIAEYRNKNGNDLTKLKFSDGKRKDDGVVTLKGVEQEIQFVLAINGQQEQIRMEHLERYGHAPGVKNMTWEGTKNNRTIPEQESEAFETGEILEKLRSLIQDAVHGKIKPKYKGMWLGVVFDDYTPPVNEKTTLLYTKVCDGVVEEYIDQLKDIYPRIIFTGISGKYIKHYDL